MMLRTVVISTTIAVYASIGHAAEKCSLSGSGYQWLADYCLLKIETDDLIAAQDCMDAESKNAFSSECEQKRYYKKLMCHLSITKGVYVGTEQSCIDDPSFMGNVVRNNGL